MTVKRKVAASAERWAFRTPFKITGYTFNDADLLHVAVTENGVNGYGEAAGVYFLNETGKSMLAQVESVKSALERGADREELRELLPAGGARNAVDCALWDLEAKLKHQSIWQLTGLQPGVTQSVYTIGIGTPEEMAKKALLLDNTKIKVKLNGDSPLECISAVCAVRPDAEIIVDVNQGWTFEQLVELAPRFKKLESP
jgi:L-alanine-DL-glutamate epimerase-like enolase superfamily enzyme